METYTKDEIIEMLTNLRNSFKNQYSNAEDEKAKTIGKAKIVAIGQAIDLFLDE